jgi:hypothetical protein
MWNHRVVRRKLTGDEAEVAGEYEYAIHEAYYDLPGSEIPNLSWTANAIAPRSETLEGLRETLERMLRALDQPVIEDEGSSAPECPNCKTNRYVHTNDPEPRLMCFGCSTYVGA